MVREDLTSAQCAILFSLLMPIVGIIVSLAIMSTSVKVCSWESFTLSPSIVLRLTSLVFAGFETAFDRQAGLDHRCCCCRSLVLNLLLSAQESRLHAVSHGVHVVFDYVECVVVCIFANQQTVLSRTDRVSRCLQSSHMHVFLSVFLSFVALHAIRAQDIFTIQLNLVECDTPSPSAAVVWTWNALQGR